MSEDPLVIIQDEPGKYHFKTKDDQRVKIEHRDEKIVVALFKWGEETSLQLLLDTVPAPNHRFFENKIEVENPDFLLRVYPIDTRSTSDFYGDTEDDIQCHDGGLRFELVLKKKRPAMNNSFSFPLVAKNLRFSYQPFLTPEDIESGVSCPLNVEGSYAVYHVSKKNNQYTTGKAFHLYRPIAEDALGTKAWCSIQFNKYIDPTNLTVTIPQQFLDDAEYPITIDPDFGYTTIGSLSATIAVGTSNQRKGCAWTMPAGGPFIANYMRARIWGNVTDNVKAFINQKDSGGADIHAQIATKENLACAAAEHWEEFTLAGEALTSGVDYILNVMGDDIAEKQNYYVKYDSDGTTLLSYYDLTAVYTPPEDPWTPIASGTFDYSIYVNYSPPGWTGKISGVTNPAKIAGVAVANIAKVKGVA